MKAIRTVLFAFTFLGIGLFLPQTAIAQFICADKTVATQSHSAGSRATYDRVKTWDAGKTLKIKFLNGEPFLKSKVQQYAVIWTQYANIHFEFVEEGPSDIRILFDDSDQSWSYIGKDAETIAMHEKTMNFGWFTPDTKEEDFKRTILHEFGHALGLLHEHKNPKANIVWNKPAVYADYLQSQSWEPEDVDHNVFGRYSVSHSNGIYDQHSIMHYPIPKKHLLVGEAVGVNFKLSDQDKKYISELYPKEPSSPALSLIKKKTVNYDSLKEFRFGKGQKSFVINWSGCNSNCMHFYKNNNNFPIALVNDSDSLSGISDPSKYDRSSRVKTAFENEIVVIKRSYGYYAAIKVIEVQYAGRSGDTLNRLSFEYKIFPEPMNSSWNYDNSLYQNLNSSGVASFDYSKNDHIYAIGLKEELFELYFGGCNFDCIRLYNDPNSISAIYPSSHYPNRLSDLDIDQLQETKRTLDIQEGGFGLLKNKSGHYLAIKVIDVKYRNRKKDTVDQVVFEYHLLK